MRKYTILFTITYFVITIIIAVITTLLEIGGELFSGIVATFAASALAAWKFANDQGREPSLEEKKSFAWQALLSIWIVSLLVAGVVIAILLSPDERKEAFDLITSQTFLLITFGVTIFVSLIYYVVIRWSFAWYAKIAIRNHRAATQE